MKTNGEVWAALIEKMNQDRSANEKIQNPFADMVHGQAPARTARQCGSKGQGKDYPGLLLFQLEALGYRGFDREHVFHPSRKWRLDLVQVEFKIAIECHGGVFTGGRHVRGGGFTKDREKMNAAVLLGWKVLEFTAAQIKSGAAVNEYIELFETIAISLSEY